MKKSQTPTAETGGTPVLPTKDYENYDPYQDPDLEELFQHQEWCTKKPCICIGALYQDIDIRYFSLVTAENNFTVN